MIRVAMTSELSWQRNGAITYFTCSSISFLQYINNLETKRSYKRTVYLNTLKFFRKFIEQFKNYSLIC